MADNFYYSESEQIAFWVAGYISNDGKVDDLIQNLNKGKDQLITLIGQPCDKVSTAYINNSLNYKSMRVFWATVDKQPKGAYPISNENGWTMWKWLEA